MSFWTLETACFREEWIFSHSFHVTSGSFKCLEKDGNLNICKLRDNFIC